MAQRICSVEGCDRKHQARGYCGTHYNRLVLPRAKRYAAVEANCETCGKSMVKQADSRRPVRFCSAFCRDLWCVDNRRGGQGGLGGRPRKPLVYDQPSWPEWVGGRCPIVRYECRVCRDAFYRGRGRHLYCSKRCANKARALRRGRRHNIRRVEIFERDDYMCWLCDQPCDREAKVPCDLAATADHIIPRARGGSDDPENLATAHFICNSTRQDSWEFPEVVLAPTA